MKFNGFLDLATCGQTASGAMAFVANADAIIFDLRDNYGGDMNMVAFIASYLFDRPTSLGGTGGIQFWTVQFVPGKRVPDVPVYVLTSSRTFSGAEAFCFHLKRYKRATIVGETTGGGAHPTRPERIDDRYVMNTRGPPMPEQTGNARARSPT